MPKLSDLQDTHFRTVLAYGDSGAGKTVFGAGFPGPIWIADFDGKVSSAASFYKGTPQYDLIEYDTYSGHSAWMPFVKRINELAKFPKDQFPFKTIVVDSITTFSASMMEEVMKQNPGSQRSKMLETQVPNLKDYQIAISHCKDVIKKILSFRDRCNIVMTAHIQKDKDETTGEILFQPLIWGKDLPTWLPMVFEEVYRCYAEVKEGKSIHWAQTRAEKKYIARTQIPKLPSPVKLGYDEMKKHF